MALIRLRSAEETAQFARSLASNLSAGDTILLFGDLGAGKTHFARSLILSLLPVAEDVPSPTYTIVQVYDTDAFDIWHVDLYRASGPDDSIELGLVDAFETSVCLIEWPDRLGDERPENALSLTLKMTEIPGERLLSIEYSDDKWAGKLPDG